MSLFLVTLVPALVRALVLPSSMDQVSPMEAPLRTSAPPDDRAWWTGAGLLRCVGYPHNCRTVRRQGVDQQQRIRL